MRTHRGAPDCRERWTFLHHGRRPDNSSEPLETFLLRRGLHVERERRWLFRTEPGQRADVPAPRRKFGMFLPVSRPEWNDGGRISGNCCPDTKDDRHTVLRNLPAAFLRVTNNKRWARDTTLVKLTTSYSSQTDSVHFSRKTLKSNNI